MTTAVVLQDLERDVAGLEREKLSRDGRRRVKDILARIDALQKQLAPLRLSFSPQAAGEQIVAKLQSAEGGAWSDVEFRRQFALSSAVLHRRRKEYRVIYWRDARGDYFYPRWQFTEMGAVLAGIQDVLQIFRSPDEWRVMRYFLGRQKQLSGQRPLDLLRAGKIERVLAHARNHAAENTW